MTEIKLPDFDDMLLIADNVGELTTRVAMLRAEKEGLLAEITRRVTVEKEFWPGEKQPAMNYIDATFHKLGINVETKSKIEALNMDLAHATGNLERKKMMFQVYRDMVDAWKANEYNKREAVS